MFEGTITALITPFKNGKIDERAYQDLVEWQINQGVHGLVPSGTTGESSTLDHVEHNRVVQLCVEASAGRVPVIAGAGSNSTQESILMATHAKQVGANAILMVTPYYNKPSQTGLFEHFRAVHDAVDLPMVLYNIPARSVIDMHDDTIAKLANLPNVVGLKDATADLVRVSSLKKVLGDTPFCLLSGEDATALAFNAQGGVGCISVTSNVLPSEVAKVQDLWKNGDMQGALKLHERIIPLHQAMFCDPNPGPAKYALSLLGRCHEDLRLPLVPPPENKKKQIASAMQELGII